MSAEDLQQEEEKGGRFVYFMYTISILVVTFRRTSDVYLVRGGENPGRKSLPFTIVSAIFGWWGIPFGPRHTIASIRTNLKGGKDVTDEVMQTVAGHLIFREAEKQKSAERTYLY